jgi:DNA mismatch endonuclease (patch repair protein)
MDRISKLARSENMRRIRGKDTKPELALRSALHRLGLRFRLHRNDLPGKPDIVFPKKKAVIDVRGCFWHRHDCSDFRWPSDNQAFWQDKISSTVDRDRRNGDRLVALGYRVAIVWECALRRKSDKEIVSIARLCAKWLRSEKQTVDISGPRSGG